MKSIYVIEDKDLGFEALIHIWQNEPKIALSNALIEKVILGRKHLEQILAKNEQAIYGINTGFGSLCNTVIPEKQLDLLQINLIRSHACGSSKLRSIHSSRLILLLKIISLSKGNSCVRIEIVQFLIWLYNENIIPCIPEMGSLGASGDLAPLAHMSLPIIGEGEVWYQGVITPTFELVLNHVMTLPGLKAKEGLALLNGTQYSLSLLLESCFKAKMIYTQSNLIAALSMEAFNASTDFLNPELNQIRRQLGQIETAKSISEILKGSELYTRTRSTVQDPYSFRCIPQVHGASLDVILYCIDIINREINSVTDNPVLIEDRLILSGGNFHTQPLGFASDFLGIALAELGNISERRIYQLISGSRDLPEFLTNNPGLNSGYMIVQYAAAGYVSINKQFASPSSVDSIVTSKGQEDHVSMAANAGLKCEMIAKNVQFVMAMEWMTAVRAWSFRPNWKLNTLLNDKVLQYLEQVPLIEDDHIPSLQYDTTIEFLENKCSQV